MKGIKIKCCIAAALLMTGCGQTAGTQKYRLRPMDQMSFSWSINPVYPYQDGFFTIDIAQSLLVYYEHCETPVLVTEVFFRNDKPLSEAAHEELRYQEYGSSPFAYVYGDQVLYLSQYANADGESHFNLNAVSLDGKTRTTIRKLDYEPLYFIMHDGILAIDEAVYEIKENEGTGTMVQAMQPNILHIYDESGKEINTVQLAGQIGRMQADGNYIYYTEMDRSSGWIRRIITETGEVEELREGDNMVFVNQGRMSLYTPGGLVDGRFRYLNSRIEDEKGEILFEAEDDCIIEYFDDGHIFIADLRENNQKYLVYDWEGNLLMTIDPLQSGIPAPYEGIVRIIGDQLIGQLNSQPTQFFACSLSDGGCRVLENPEYHFPYQ